MDKKTHNPTPWLQGFGLNHAVEVSGTTRTVYLSGQTASGPDGTALHPGDIVAQYKSAWQCVKDALAAADMTPANLVRMNFYVTDVDAFMAAAEHAGSIVCNKYPRLAVTLYEWVEATESLGTALSIWINGCGRNLLQFFAHPLRAGFWARVGFE